MFEKCGLRDILYRFWVLRKVILISVCVIVVIGIVGLAINNNNNKANNTETPELTTTPSAEDNKASTRWFTVGYAYFYVSSDSEINGGELEETEKYYASTYVDVMKTYPAQVAVYERLLKKYTKNELAEKIDKLYYSEVPINFLSLISKAYKIRVSSGAIVELYVEADDSKLCSELLQICKDVLVEMTTNISGSKLIQIGTMHSSASQEIKNNVEDEKEKTEINNASTLEIKNKTKEIMMGMIGAVVILIIVVIASAIFLPTINRIEDVVCGSLEGIGEFNEKKVEVLACIIEQYIKEQNIHNLGLVSTKKPGSKMDKFYEALLSELIKRDVDICKNDELNEKKDRVVMEYIWAPNQSANEIDKLKHCDGIVGVEIKGISTYKQYESLISLLKIMGINANKLVLVK